MFQIIDYVIIGVVLIALLIGLIKGFFGLVSGCLSLFIAIAICIFLTPVVAGPLEAGSAGQQLTGTMTTKLESVTFLTYGAYTQDDAIYLVKPTEEVGAPMAEVISGEDGLTATALGLLSKPLESLVVSKFTLPTSAFEAQPMSSYIAPVIAGIIIKAVCFLVIFIVSLIVLSIINRFADRLLEIRALKILDKIFGLVTCGALAAIFIVAFLYVATTFVNVEALNVQIDNSPICKALLELEFIQSLFGTVAAKTGGGGEEAAAMRTIVRLLR